MARSTDKEKTAETDFFLWDNEDVGTEVGFDASSCLEDKKAKPRCVIKCWMEDWGVEAVAKMGCSGRGQATLQVLWSSVL